jgi:endonuclease/exonuclease/phosphatase family metal-dependent hydrolase
MSDPGFTDDGRTNPLANLVPRPRKRIDYVLVGDPFLRKGGAGLVERAALWGHEVLGRRLPSDHYGVVAELRWPQRPPA